MNEKIILSNNPLLDEREGGLAVRRVETLGLKAVFETARELTQTGFKLVSAPLPPNVPLIRAPYRSLILASADRQYDVDGILILEKALNRATDLGEASFSEQAGQDAAFIDRELLHRSLTELAAAGT